MMSKIKKCSDDFDCNRQMILMNGANPRDILRALDGKMIGTLFAKEKLWQLLII